MSTLTQHQSVWELHMEHSYGGFATYVCFLDEDRKVHGLMDLPRYVFDDMGQPDTITVTVVAGDQLNGPDVS